MPTSRHVHVPSENSYSEVIAERVRHGIASLKSYYKSILVNVESITLCKAFRVGTLDSHSTEMPRPVKSALSSVGGQQFLLNRRKELKSIMKDYLFHESYGRVKWLKYCTLTNGGITMKKVGHWNFLWRTPVTMTGE